MISYNCAAWFHCQKSNRIDVRKSENGLHNFGAYLLTPMRFLAIYFSFCDTTLKISYSKVKFKAIMILPSFMNAYYEVVAAQFCIWHDNSPAVEHGKFCSDKTTNNNKKNVWCWNNCVDISGYFCSHTNNELLVQIVGHVWTARETRALFPSWFPLSRPLHIWFTLCNARPAGSFPLVPCAPRFLWNEYQETLQGTNFSNINNVHIFR